MEVEIGPAAAAGQFTVRVLRSVGAGKPTTTCALDVERLLAQRQGLEDSILASSVEARRVTPAHESSLEAVGTLLFDAVFAGQVREAYRTSVAVAENRGEGVRLLLRLMAPGLTALPWEALYDREGRNYLCRKEPLLRQIGTTPSTPTLPLEPPLRVLALIASPSTLPSLDVAGERARLEEALAEQVEAGWIHLEWLLDASWQRLHEKLLDETWHVLHFIGHGSYDLTRDEGVLAFVGRDGRPDLVNASRFTDLLHEARQRPRLVVLNACLTAAESTDDLFSGTAAALVRSGINAVAAMQFAISDKAAIAFARGFYMSLAHGRLIDEAMRSGRIAILGVARDTLEWVTPVLCVRGDDTRLFDVNPSAAPVPPVSPTGEHDQPGVARTAPPPAAREQGHTGSVQVQPAQGAATVGGPPRIARHARSRRHLAYAAAAVLVLATAGTAATLRALDRVTPADNEITADAPWRLEISSDPTSGGCTVAVTNTDTRYEEVFKNVWGTKTFQMQTAGTFRWQADDPGCLVRHRSGSGKAVLPFSQKPGEGDTDAFAAPKAPGTVVVQVQAFNGYRMCTFELHDAADGRLVARATVAAPAKGPLRLDPLGRSQVYLSDFSGCDILVSAET
ncbi:CHAT domain-containing protein [Humibacillus xanthopallidus]|uniref:CHAT domain-containing protein n=1 Tax=Humibacillus xanthopallidus TaxID=412689 RepID=A0A543HXB3_9MICO|nr:CHAT domain-containing protein [Humibacillus xanthopallidus]TQM62875.1 CHAT domain-containing protein [Humibacillus xanthopallidus]